MREKINNVTKMYSKWFATLGVLILLLVNLANGLFASAQGLGNVITGNNTNTKATQEGCAIKIETTENVSWTLPRQPIDLVILQDASGSFKNTIENVKKALKELVTPVALEKYNENDPRLVFTGDPKTTDRVMFNTFQGLDSLYNYSSNNGFTGRYTESRNNQEYQYKVVNSGLLTSKAEIDKEINKISVKGATPTVPAIDDTIAQYNKIKGNMENNRKTVFLLITDGAANGVRRNGKVIMERNGNRETILQRYFLSRGVPESDKYVPEAGQNYLERARELEEAGEKLKKLVISDDNNPKNDGAVVVGFWEDLPSFQKGGSYGTTYLEGFAGTGVNTGDNRPVQEVFSSALKKIASKPEYYVNEQTDIEKFTAKVRAAVGQALVKEDVSGDFTVTEGYTVESVTINNKKVVAQVKDDTKEVRGTVTQNGTHVKISVPESVFNPGNNTFDYELKRTEEPEMLDEANEQEPPSGYVPPKVQRDVGQLVGTFKVGEFESAQIGSSKPVKVEVTDLKYCYPRAIKDVKDADISNDTNGDDGKTGVLAQDPLLVNEQDPSKTIKRSSYAATLTTDSEEFTYTVDYNMYNVPLEMKKNVMLVDKLNYHVQYISAQVTDENGKPLPNFAVSTQDTQDAMGNATTAVVVKVPELPGVNTETVKEGQYGGHKFKKYKLVIKAKIKDEYSLAKNPTEYYKMMQANNGLGFENQASVIWNGDTDSIADKTASSRLSNAVYVTPPVKTDIKKAVTQSLDQDGSNHLELATKESKYFYTIESTWPGIFDHYLIEDLLVPELESLNSENQDKVYVNGKESKELQKYLKVEKNVQQADGTMRDRVYLEMKKDALKTTELRRINREIEKLNKGNNGPAVIKLGISAKIRDGANLTKYTDDKGKVKVPNEATVTLNNHPQTSNKVTVSPNTPSISKTVNGKTEYETKTTGEEFTYDLYTTLPSTINKYKQYYIKDVISDKLEIVEAKIVGSNQNAFTVEILKNQQVEEKGQKVTRDVVNAKIKEGSFASVKANDVVHLQIKAKFKPGVTESVENVAHIGYNNGDKPTDPPVETPPTPPVVVTPPGIPPVPTKTVDNKQTLTLDTLNQEFTYAVKVRVPENTRGFTKFEIKDKLEDVLTATQTSVTIDGKVDNVVQVTKEANNVVMASLPIDKLNDYRGKEIVLTIKARIKEGITSAELASYVKTDNPNGAIPNKAQLIVGDKPEHTVDSNEVPVTPPNEEPTIEKKINGDASSATVLPDSDYTYNVKVKLPRDISTYKEFKITDDVDARLAIQKVEFSNKDVAKFFKVMTAGQNVSAEITDFNGAKNFAGQEVELVITAQVKKESLPVGSTDSVNNTAKVTYKNNAHANGKPSNEKTTPPVPVTVPSLTKKINEKLDHLDTPTLSNYTYNIKTVLPSDITTYKTYVITDNLEKELRVEGTPKITGEAANFFDINVDGQKVTATMKNFENAKQLAGQEVELVITAQIQEGVTKQNIPNEATITYTNRAKVNGEPGKTTTTPPTPPVTVSPPGENPTVEKKINKDLSEATILPGTDYNYNIKAHLPVDITKYKAYVITDTLDDNLVIKGEPTITGGAANFFDVKVEGQKVTATMKDFAKASDLAGQEVELVITAQVKVSEKPVPVTNTAKVTYRNNFHVDGQPDGETETPPVTVTPPPVTKKINEKLDHLDIDTQKDYTYNIKTVLPSNIDTYKTFVITDTLAQELAVQGKPVIKGKAANFFDVKVEGQKVTATIKDFVKAKEFAGQEVELVLTAQIKAGMTRQNIPNTTSITYANTVKVDGTPEIVTTPPTPPVTVTPPGENPTVEKTINGNLTEATVLPNTDYTYNIKAHLPVDITRYKAYAIVDELDNNLAIQGTPKITGDATKFFDVKVDGQKVTATMKDFAKATDLAGKKVELVITAQVKPTDKPLTIGNTAKVTYQNKSHVDGQPDGETETPPVTVTPPPVTKKINETLEHLDTDTQKDYTYNIKTVLPSNIDTYKTFVITDTLESELTVQGTPKITGDAAEFFDVKVDGQKVTATMKDFVKAKHLANKEIELVITAQIKAGVTRQNIPNTATITYDNKVGVNGVPGETTTTPPTPPVTVTPPGENPTVEKTINGNLTEATVLPNTDYTYNIKAHLPVDITRYKAYAIVDELDNNLAIQGIPTITGEAAKFFDVKVDGQKVTATMKDFTKATDLAGQKVELVITARVKGTAKFEKIENTAKVTYQNKSHVDGQPDNETPTPPVTVTPPPVTKKINGNLDHLDTDTQKDYTYNIKTVLPHNIDTYKTFVITDTLEGDISVQGQPVITGEAAKFFDVKVDGQKVTATMKDFANAKHLANKEVELVITAQIKAGVTRQNIPNTATITYGNKVDVNGVPEETTTPPTPPVTVTPPGENPTVEKTINGNLTEATVLPETDYTYHVKATLPVDITRYKAYAIVDELDNNLSIQGTPIIVGEAAKFFDVKVDGQKVTATMKDFVHAEKLAGQSVKLVITARVKGTAKFEKIENTAKVTYQNKSHVDGTPDSQTPPTPPVTVTPPPVTKKINGNLDHLDIDTKTNYTYNIKTVLPHNIDTYKTFVITDTLESELTVQGTPTITGEAAKFFDVKVDGQKVTATMKDFAKATDLAGKEVELVITAQIKAGVTRQNIPNTATITYGNKVGVDGVPGETTTTPPTPPVTVTPPGENPTVEKTINGTLSQAIVLPETDYTYHVKATLPVDIARYKAYAIVDELDENLAVQGTPTITGEAAKFFDVKVDGQKVTATMKDFAHAEKLAGQSVELVITVQVKGTAKFEKIENTAKVTYQNKSHVDGTPDSQIPPTPPVTVTPPPVTKKINGTLDNLDTPTQTNYTYNIKTVLPSNIDTYKTFVITDTLESELTVQGTPIITGEAAKFFDVKVDGQKVTATMRDFANAKHLANKEVELVITAQIKAGVTRQAIPNTATITYGNKVGVDGVPGETTTTPPTPPVIVTPPGDIPVIEKKVNNTLEHLDVDTEVNYTYNVVASLPIDIHTYKQYVITDTLDSDLEIQGTPTITGEAAKFFNVKVDGQKVTATMKNFVDAKSLAGQRVELIIVSQIREGVVRPNIPNTASLEFVNKLNETGTKESKPVTVTPPVPNTPPIQKKVNDKASAHLVSRQEVVRYTVESTVPTGAFAFELSDTLEKVLAFDGEVTATLAGEHLPAEQVTISGQTITLKLTKQQVREKADQIVKLEFSAKVKSDADLTPYTSGEQISVPNTAHYIINNNPATKVESNIVPITWTTPKEPEIDKKINRTLTHLDINANQSYIYNVTASIPQDIDTYREYVITDVLESVLAINGEVVAYVDGYTTDAIKVEVVGNKVIAKVVDFAQLKTYKQIQLYIPAYIKAGVDLSAYREQKIPNTAQLNFRDSNGMIKHKDSLPVTVTPTTPDKPTPPDVMPPKPGQPVKTVSRLEGLEQTSRLELSDATEAFRFDIKSIVPSDEAKDKRTNLTSLTITDKLDPLFTVQKDRVAIKVTDAPKIPAQYIHEDVKEAQAALDAEKAKLEAIKQSNQVEANTQAVNRAEENVKALTLRLQEAQKRLAELEADIKQTESAESQASASSEQSAAEKETTIAKQKVHAEKEKHIAAQKELILALQTQLKEAQAAMQKAKDTLANTKTTQEIKVELENQQKVIAAKQKVLEGHQAKQAKVNEKLSQLAKINEKGELTPEAIKNLGGVIKVEGQLVTVDFTDEYTMEALKGYTVQVIIYSVIKDKGLLNANHFAQGIENTATVQFNHNPDAQFTKETNPVTVVPPMDKPTPKLPEKPRGELPTPNRPILPKTGTAPTDLWVNFGYGLILLGWMVIRNKRLFFRKLK